MLLEKYIKHYCWKPKINMDILPEVKNTKKKINE
ncbi:MAG: hypothetical protein MRERV_6c024 [Mycoplasmataceae bacterium RV_VA103A]|nr:MAG: hypothetical protein MRERV_6c024 [Mycoplasmataceae bacterium RV_VA103A]